MFDGKIVQDVFYEPGDSETMGLHLPGEEAMGLCAIDYGTKISAVTGQQQLSKKGRKYAFPKVIRVNFFVRGRFFSQPEYCCSNTKELCRRATHGWISARTKQAGHQSQLAHATV